MSTAVEDVMTREVVTVSPDTSFRDVVRLLEDRHVDAFPVVESGKVVGIISESDLLLKEEGPEGGHTGMPWQRRRDRMRAGATCVSEAMTRHVITVAPGTTLSAAARLMHRHRIGGLPVVDENGHLLGIVTRSDLLTVFLREDGDLCAEVQAAMHPALRDKITCTVRDGQVTLTGRTAFRSDAVGASGLARRVPGVISVENRVTYDTDDVEVAMVGP